MKKSRKRTALIALCAIVAAGITGVGFWLFGNAEPASATVSTGMQYLADQALVAACAPVGEPISFTPEWFDQTLRGERVSAITVTALPDATAGELMLGYGEVSVGQSIRRENLSYLTFSPAEGVTEADFSFVPSTVQGDAGYAMTCRLSFTDGVNCCPSGTKSVKAVSTHATLALTGVLTAEDPEGDALCFEVVEYPANGTLTLDSATGHFSYLPTGDFSGEDAFVWRVQDVHGAFSDSSTVSITVRELSTGYLFSDMEDHRAHSDALHVAEMGLMGGEMTGGKHYFHPDRALTRAAFVTVLLKAAEIEAPFAEQTGFADNDDIPHGMRGAIAYAKEKGWLGEEDVFRPNDPITRAEAAEIATRVLKLSAPGYSDAVEDHSTIPVSVVDALYAAYEGGYIATMGDGTLAPAKALTRAEAAGFFARVLDERE